MTYNYLVINLFAIWRDVKISYVLLKIQRVTKISEQQSSDVLVMAVE